MLVVICLAVYPLAAAALGGLDSVPEQPVDRQFGQQVDQAETDDFGSLLELVETLNVRASWRETRAALERARPRLDQANSSEYARFRILEARNLTISGDVAGGLAVLEALLQKNLERRHELRVLELGANLAMIDRDYARAFTFLNQGLKFEFTRRERDQWIGLLSLAAYTYARVGRLERALDYGGRALELAVQSGQARDLCLASQRLGFVYKTRNEPVAAEAQYRNALDYCDTAQDPIIGNVARYGLGDLLREAGLFEQAERLFIESIEGLEASGYATGIDEVHLYQARLQTQRGGFERAGALLEPLLARFAEQKNWDYHAEALLMLSDIAAWRNDHSQAHQMIRRAMASREKYLAVERAMRLALAEVEFDTRFTEQENALLREQAAVAVLQQQTRREQARLRLALYALGLFVLLVLGFLLAVTLRQRRHFQRQSWFDGLTQLRNHTQFFEIAAGQVEQAHAQTSRLALVLGDIDFFKQFNDRHGHPVGDEVLRRVGACLRKDFGSDALVGRVGGEEFGICLGSMALMEVEAMVNRLRDSLAALNGAVTNEGITMSFGIAMLEPGEAVDELRRRADVALYQAKRGGRDRIEIATRPQAGAAGPA
ncbi:MAG: diguanylate cyclase [Wenzhouxiangellaceae bacterium]|nr:diguanylate cyclase [Wenzhouxiangellaceae bacterium]